MKKLTYKSRYLPETVTVTFKCDCGCEEFEREEEQKTFSHVEGFYNCKNCKAEHDYCSENFTSKYQSIKEQQLSLF